MLKKLIDLLPSEISDESAYQLVNFFMELTAELESHYFAKMQRYVKDNTPLNPPNCLQENHF
jgi:hypothetical protein